MSESTISSGGGFHIFPESIIILQNDHQINSGQLLIAGEKIKLNFRYDCYFYGGKPYGYEIFKIFEVPQMPADKKMLLVGVIVFKLPSSAGGGYGEIEFDLPKPRTNYLIVYHSIPFASSKKLESARFGGFLNQSEVNLVDQYYQDPSNYSGTQKLISIATAAQQPSLPPEAYLTVYIMNFARTEEDIIASRPLTFQWEKGPETSAQITDIKYSYRLTPIEDWSIYDVESQATYDFLRPGNYVFQVKAKYKVGDKVFESSIAQRSFTLEKQIFGKTKGVASRNSPVLDPTFLKAKHYGTSRALLIGIPQYHEMGTFLSLMFVKEDIRLMDEVLKSRYGFQVDLLVENPVKEQILKKLNDLLLVSDTNDRVIVYFSCHGTSIKDAGFLVPADANSENIVGTCISFEYLKSWIDRMLNERKVKHILLILDSCHSGLGVYSKSPKRSLVTELASYSSAHMMTAGLVDQEAFADMDMKESVFTRYFVEGLQGDADFNHDTVITLTELLVFLQDKVPARVAKISSEKSQIPVMGKIRGAGEMLFFLGK